ncbi:hypothetical protein ACFL6Y_02195 [Elusimicrobiota bacterium]
MEDTQDDREGRWKKLRRKKRKESGGGVTDGHRGFADAGEAESGQENCSGDEGEEKE